jgi:hypothetical protein
MRPANGSDLPCCIPALCAARYSLGISISRANPASLVSGGFHPRASKAEGSATSAPDSRSYTYALPAVRNEN